MFVWCTTACCFIHVWPVIVLVPWQTFTFWTWISVANQWMQLQRAQGMSKADFSQKSLYHFEQLCCLQGHTQTDKTTYCLLRLTRFSFRSAYYKHCDKTEWKLIATIGLLLNIIYSICSVHLYSSCSRGRSSNNNITNQLFSCYCFGCDDWGC